MQIRNTIVPAANIADLADADRFLDMRSALDLSSSVIGHLALLRWG